ncbi:hypothetical protein HDV05_004275 [Chytridiales sp. JEL 0842]|nr:hypothetical protein HDV05_004275 [Chytridiales sp. JEL 0842]
MAHFEPVSVLFSLLLNDEEFFMNDDWSDVDMHDHPHHPDPLEEEDNNPNRPSIIQTLPKEVLSQLFTFSDPRTARRLSESCSLFRDISRNPAVRVKWLLNHYGHKNAFEGSLRWTGLLNLPTFECLLKSVGKVPRYVLQRAFIRLKETNKSHLLITLLNYGLELWKNLELHKSDTQVFKELAGSHISVSISGAASLNEKIIDSIKNLVDNYGFDVNFCKFSSMSGLPDLNINEGYRYLLIAISAGQEKLVTELLRCGMVTHLRQPKLQTQSREFRFIHTWESRWMADNNSTFTYFPADIRSILPASADAIFLATRSRNINIMRVLLDTDIDRWETDEGRNVLNICLQLAVDDSFVAGIDLIKLYTDGMTPKKSATALRKLLIEACISGEFAAIKDLLAEGARFEVTLRSPYTYRHIDPIKQLIIQGRNDICIYLLENYKHFDDEKLRELLNYTVEIMENDLVKAILKAATSIRYILSDKTLRRCIVCSNLQAFNILIDELLRVQPNKPIAGFNTVLKLATKRFKDGKTDDSYVKLLSKYTAQIESNKKKSSSRKKLNAGIAESQTVTTTKGKSAALATNVTESKPAGNSKLEEDANDAGPSSSSSKSGSRLKRGRANETVVEPRATAADQDDADDGNLPVDLNAGEPKRKRIRKGKEPVHAPEEVPIQSQESSSSTSSGSAVASVAEPSAAQPAVEGTSLRRSSRRVAKN